jgi:type VI secretion system secreted protein VgrG
MPPVDFQAGTIALVLLLVLFAILSVRSGIRTIQAARRMTFYHLRKQREASGWRQLGLGVLLLLGAVALPIYGLPIAYQYFPPSPTPSITPSITPVPSVTLSPTITITPTLTDTPVESPTPTASATPNIPAPIEALFQSSVTPNPDVVFSPLEFTLAGGDYPAVKPDTVFQNPVRHMYGIFSYDGMLPGVQWTALWSRDGVLVSYESYPWNGGTGGAYFTEWNPAPDQWKPGIYTVQLFVGEQFVLSGRFLVEGAPPTAVVTLTPVATSTATASLPGAAAPSGPALPSIASTASATRVP